MQPKPTDFPSKKSAEFQIGSSEGSSPKEMNGISELNFGIEKLNGSSRDLTRVQSTSIIRASTPLDADGLSWPSKWI